MAAPEYGGRPPQQLAVPLRHAIPDPPHIFPALETGAIKEGLLDAICVVLRPPGKNTMDT
jgi:hypothetical protein